MNRITIFLSYVEDEEGRTAAALLAEKLESAGFLAIRAPEQIPPGADWALLIQRFLEESAALVVVGTAGVSRSSWCQQEIGWALGRHVPVLWIRFDSSESPCGFLAFKQVLEAVSSKDLSRDVIEWLCRQDDAALLLTDSWIEALEESDSFRSSEEIARRLARVGRVSFQQWERITRAARENSQVRDAHVSGVTPGKWPTVIAWLESRLEVVTP